jgi:DNA-binding response OmpR family regulator
MSCACQRTILVVEDQALLRRMMCRALERHGFLAAPAGRASLGLDIVRQRKGAVDLAIADMVLPGMSGLDLAAHLEREFPTIPVLYISGHADSLAMDCISYRSPSFVLLKPFTMDTLVQRVDLLLGMAGAADLGREGVAGGLQSRSGTGD